MCRVSSIRPVKSIVQRRSLSVLLGAVNKGRHQVAITVSFVSHHLCHRCIRSRILRRKDGKHGKISEGIQFLGELSAGAKVHLPEYYRKQCVWSVFGVRPRKEWFPCVSANVEVAILRVNESDFFVGRFCKSGGCRCVEGLRLDLLPSNTLSTARTV
jgi:hypothetical protein